MRTALLLEEVISSLKKIEIESVYQIMKVDGLELLLKRSNEELSELEDLVKKQIPSLPPYIAE